MEDYLLLKGSADYRKASDTLLASIDRVFPSAPRTGAITSARRLEATAIRDFSGQRDLDELRADYPETLRRIGQYRSQSLLLKRLLRGELDEPLCPIARKRFRPNVEEAYKRFSKGAKADDSRRIFQVFNRFMRAANFVSVHLNSPQFQVSRGPEWKGFEDRMKTEALLVALEVASHHLDLTSIQANQLAPPEIWHDQIHKLTSPKDVLSGIVDPIQNALELYAFKNNSRRSQIPEGDLCLIDEVLSHLRDCRVRIRHFTGLWQYSDRATEPPRFVGVTPIRRIGRKRGAQ